MRDGLLANPGAVCAVQEVSVRTDEPGLTDWLTAHGVPVPTSEGGLGGRTPTPPRAVAVPLDYVRPPSRRALRDVFSASSVPWIPPASFSVDPQVARYDLEGFSEIGTTGCIAAKRRIISQLLLNREEVWMAGSGTDLDIRLPERLRLSSRTRPELVPDEHATIGNCFEVAVSPRDLAGRVDSELTVSEKLRIDSVIVAHHRELTGAPADRFRAAAETAEEARKSCPPQVRIQDNRFVDGFGPFADCVHAVGAPGHRGAVAEAATGTCVLSAGRLDRSLNCLLNEGAAGVRPGVGDGLTGIPSELISRKARLDTL
ncbi:hypothetical protein ABT215_26740 [Streptomyces sp900105755]|uniref:hypothetical protein n=1 Tax=Streptomyces sp. 900105755 TaxID=3154389 RepID=UPI00331A96BC